MGLMEQLLRLMRSNATSLRWASVAVVVCSFVLYLFPSHSVDVVLEKTKYAVVVGLHHLIFEGSPSH